MYFQANLGLVRQTIMLGITTLPDGLKVMLITYLLSVLELVTESGLEAIPLCQKTH